MLSTGNASTENLNRSRSDCPSETRMQLACTVE